MSSTTPLSSTSDTLSETLRARLPGFGMIEWLDSTPSTNQDLILRARQPDSEASLNPMPWLRGAREQTAGKGRAGRPWQNTSDATLMFSCAFAPEIPLVQLPGLAPALGVAACEALRELIRQQVSDLASMRLGVKWPNDLQWRSVDASSRETFGKLAGILIETAPRAGFKHPIVVAGIGINLKGAQTLSAELGRPIADWSQITNTITSAHMVTAIAQAWQAALQTYAQSGFAAFVDRYAQVDDLNNVQVNLIDQGKVLLTGTACGTDETGRLLVQTSNGIVPMMTGDVSVRPVS